MHKISFFLLITLISTNSFSQEIVFNDSIYNQNIKTVQLLSANSFFSYPIISLGTNQQLILSFDDLETDNNASDYQYTIIHCNSDWTSSGLTFSDYIDGFEENFFYDFNTSFNTQVEYSHFSVKFPNDDIQFILSGNYIIKVYKDYDFDNIILTKRFYVSENLSTIDAKIHIPSINMYKRNYQQVDFTISSSIFSSGNTLNRVKVVVSQNNRPDMTKTFLKPRFVKGNRLIFDDPQQNIFLAGNEFRFFDTKNTHFAPEKVGKIELKDIYHFFIIPEKEFENYLFRKEINGKYYIGNDKGSNAQIDADYVYVHLYLPREYPFLDDIYIIGEFNDWKFLPEYKLTYNTQYKLYQAKIKLKQGYYNYKFASKKQKLQSIDGNYNETNNNYIIFVYFKNITLNYDRLIGIKVISN